MEHVKAITIKFLSCLALLYIVLGLLYNISFASVLWITAVLGITAYVIGDMLILSRTNNFIATMADFGLAFLVIYVMSRALTVYDNPITMSLLAALGVGVFEIFFHRYVANHVFVENEHQSVRGNMQYQTEASEEIDPRILEDEED